MNRSTAIRRVLAVLFLATAVVMLAVGETTLKGRLGPFATLIYWSACLLVTGAAIVCALVDALRLLGRSRQERRALLEATLCEIEAERARRQQTGKTPPRESH